MNKKLEEVAEKYAEIYFNRDETSMGDSKTSFIDGAKWQAKRMYSEEEVLELINNREDYMNSEDNIFDYQSIKEWFEQFKNKGYEQ